MSGRSQLVESFVSLIPFFVCKRRRKKRDEDEETEMKREEKRKI